MKFNKWTVALAAIGVVSMASAAKAEEKASTAVTALTPTSISGYVDTSAAWNFGTGDANVPPYKFNSPSKSDGFNLDVIQLRIEKALDESEWAAGYRADLWFGPDANTLGTQSFFGGTPSGHAGTGDFAIRQAYVALRTPVGNGIDWKMGVFDSIIGYESVESPNDPNYTRSYGHSIEPQTHTGLLGTYRFCDCFSASAGIANTMGPAINSRDFLPVQTSNPYAESYKTYMGSIAYTAPECMGFLKGSTLYGGIVNGFNNHILGSTYAAPEMNAYVGATIATPVTGLRFGLSGDLLNMNTVPGSGFNPPGYNGEKVSADFWSLAGYASYQATEKLSFHARFEYFTGDQNQPGGLNRALVQATSTGTLYGDALENTVYATTVTVQYDLWKNVLSRVEFRWDHSEYGDIFGGTANGSKLSVAGVNGAKYADAYLLAANIIYKF